ncbi:hypothetical protein SAMN05660976_06475, partial [Nonomuraea pusilla]
MTGKEGGVARAGRTQAGGGVVGVAGAGGDAIRVGGDAAGARRVRAGA